MRSTAACRLRLLLLLLLPPALLLSDAGSRLTYSNYRLYRLQPRSQSAIKTLQRLHDLHPSDPDPSYGLTFLTYPGRPNGHVDVLAPPELAEWFEEKLASIRGLTAQLLSADYSRILSAADEQQSRSRRRRSLPPDSGLTLNHWYYRTYDELMEAVQQLHDACNRKAAGTCRLEELGTTFEGRRLVLLRIEKAQSDKQKQRVWIDAGIHAREWISPAAVLYEADVIISKGLRPTEDTASQEVKKLVDYYDFFILILYNPDGYEYSHTHNRLWRKNRQRTRSVISALLPCRGVDLNRNYGFGWGGNGSSNYTCADNFRGSAAFSAKETEAVSRFLEREHRAKKFLLFLSYHAYGQFILMPYGFRTRTYPQPAQVCDKIRCAAFIASREMNKRNNRAYIVGTSADVLYEAAGGSDDWAHGQLGIPYSLTIELPDEGTYGFVLPPAYIQNVGKEALVGLVAMMRAINGLENNANYFNRSCRHEAVICRRGNNA